jgi:hypothetical protein
VLHPGDLFREIVSLIFTTLGSLDLQVFACREGVFSFDLGVLILSYPILKVKCGSHRPGKMVTRESDPSGMRICVVSQDKMLWPATVLVESEEN